VYYFTVRPLLISDNVTALQHWHRRGGGGEVVLLLRRKRHGGVRGMDRDWSGVEGGAGTGTGRFKRWLTGRHGHENVQALGCGERVNSVSGVIQDTVTTALRGSVRTEVLEVIPHGVNRTVTIVELGFAGRGKQVLVVWTARQRVGPEERVSSFKLAVVLVLLTGPVDKFAGRRNFFVVNILALAFVRTWTTSNMLLTQQNVVLGGHLGLESPGRGGACRALHRGTLRGLLLPRSNRSTKAYRVTIAVHIIVIRVWRGKRVRTQLKPRRYLSHEFSNHRPLIMYVILIKL
jgi:hypothetical protein